LNSSIYDIVTFLSAESKDSTYENLVKLREM